MVILIIVLFLLGLVFGSFINALVWRLRKVETSKGQVNKKYSIVHGRSMCVHCKHELAAKDLIPVASWLLLRGKCRYCNKPISAQYPLVELITGVIFAVSYAFWQYPISNLMAGLLFGVWLIAVIILIALAVYDTHWYELPDRLVFPLIALSLLYAVTESIVVDDLAVAGHAVFGGAIVFALFWALFQVSNGEWIGGGDVKIAFALGVFAGGAMEAFLVIFIASLLGTLLALPGLIAKGNIKGVKIPFGPYLIAATIIVVLFGSSIIFWYQNLFAL